mmetsp:Transcript_35838/g.83033  ORF Transcript_35838/g.83033 Transcript_35838/m.83033 type:complete len:256 (-) Transcript_35838:144-911(-)
MRRLLWLGLELRGAHAHGVHHGADRVGVLVEHGAPDRDGEARPRCCARADAPPLARVDEGLCRVLLPHEAVDLVRGEGFARLVNATDHDEPQVGEVPAVLLGEKIGHQVAARAIPRNSKAPATKLPNRLVRRAGGHVHAPLEWRLHVLRDEEGRVPLGHVRKDALGEDDRDVERGLAQALRHHPRAPRLRDPFDAQPALRQRRDRVLEGLVEVLGDSADAQRDGRVEGDWAPAIARPAPGARPFEERSAQAGRED